MMKVIPAPEPDRFDAEVRQPGLRAIAELVGFQVVAAEGLEECAWRKVDGTIKRLGLSDLEFCKARAEFANGYWSGEINLSDLIRHAPFVERELRRRGRLLPEDA